MKVIGIVENKTDEDNSCTLVRVALKYIENFKYETTIIGTDDFDFSKKSSELDVLKSSLNQADAVIFATSSSFPQKITGINPFLEWMNQLKTDFSSKAAGLILLIEPEESSGTMNKGILKKEVEKKSFNIISEVVFTSVAEVDDVRSNTYALIKTMKMVDDLQKYLESSV